MKIVVLTLFPELVEPYFTTSIPAKAVERGLISYTLVNFRDFAHDRHRTCDDAPYGGGAGMVIKPEPLAEALDSVDALSHTVVYPSAAGYRFTHQVARDLSPLGDPPSSVRRLRLGAPTLSTFSSPS